MNWTRLACLGLCVLAASAAGAQEWRKPYSPPCTERENVFAFTQKPKIKRVGKDKYEITFAAEGYCDVTVGIVDANGKVVRHLGSGVLGANAPKPFRKNSLKQTLYWNGKDDLDIYSKQPQKLRVRVMLGLKPEFDRNLGGMSPKNIPGYVWGIATDPDGVTVFPHGWHMASVRRFDHDGNYIRTIFPPPAGTPPAKLGGMGYIEYEQGKRALHGCDTRPSHHLGFFMPRGVEGRSVLACKPAVAGGRIYFCSSWVHGGGNLARLHWISKDGGTDLGGMRGRPWYRAKKSSEFVFLAASPDGKHIYMTGVENDVKHGRSLPMVLRGKIGEAGPPEVFVGDPKVPGSDNAHLNVPMDIACDVEGRVYVCDRLNNRVQVFSAEGEHLKTIKVDRPRLVEVHQKTGAVYVAHAGRDKGRTTGVLTKFKAYPELSKQHHWDKFYVTTMKLDSWSPNPRLWVHLRPGAVWRIRVGADATASYSVRVLEEADGKLPTFLDFDEEAKREAGDKYHGRWPASDAEVVCDPVREHVYYAKMHKFDLKTGKYLGKIPGVNRGGTSVNIHGSLVDDMAFDKYGYMHCNVSRGLDPPLSSGIARIDPSRTEVVRAPGGSSRTTTRLVEVPYDHGSQKKSLTGAVELYRSDHHHWTWGLGVNMRGDIAVARDIEFSPRLMTESYAAFSGGAAARGRLDAQWSYESFKKMIEEQEKMGEQYFTMPRRPGSSLFGSTIFTFDRTGEVRQEAAVVTGGKTLSVQIDEDGKLYFCNRCAGQVGGKPFLAGKAGFYGEEKRFTPTTGVYVKSQPKDVLFQYEKSKIELDPMPDRPPDMFAVSVGGVSRKHRVWAKGTEWMYAGASPFPIGNCQCPQLRAHLDWYKRSYVPETYRHSIGILDANGNLIMHLGQYGNWDSGSGPKSRIPVGADGIASTFIRFVSGTDNYLVFGDWGERLCVLKLNYHAEETVGIGVSPKDGRE